MRYLFLKSKLMKRKSEAIPIVNRPESPAALFDQYVPLRYALALCHSEDIEEGLIFINQAVDQARTAVAAAIRRKTVWLTLTLPFALIATVAIFLDLANGPSPPNYLFVLELTAFIAPVLVLLAWQSWQYGAGFIASPRELPHAPDERIEAVFAEFQKESGPQVYRLSNLRGRYISVNRRLFFGRLRYLVLSENPADRLHVHPFPALLPMAGSLYISRSDTERLRDMSKPKRKAGPGRDAKYAYVDAVIGVILDGHLQNLDLSNPASAIRMLEDILLAWFESHPLASGDLPRGDMVRPYAHKIFDALERKA